MKKEEIFKKLDELELDKEQYVIISGASLVIQDIIEENGRLLGRNLSLNILITDT